VLINAAVLYFLSPTKQLRKYYTGRCPEWEKLGVTLGNMRQLGAGP
jgi:hypothetical protein